MASMGQIRQAEKVLVSQAESAKLPKRYWQLLVVIYKKLRDADKVYDTLDKWRKENPYHLEAVVLMADFHASQRNYERALSVVN